MTLTGILFIALMALLIVYLVIMLNNAIEDARLYSEMRNGSKKKKGGIPKMPPHPIPPPIIRNDSEMVLDALLLQFKANQKKMFECPKCHGRGVLVDPTDTNAIKCHICKGEGRVEL